MLIFSVSFQFWYMSELPKEMTATGYAEPFYNRANKITKGLWDGGNCPIISGLAGMVSQDPTAFRS